MYVLCSRKNEQRETEKLRNEMKSVQTQNQLKESGANSELKLLGVLMTMFDARTRLSHQVVEEVRKHFSAMVFDTVIQRNIRLGEAPSFGESIISYDATSKGAVNYINLANELIKNNS